MARKARMRPSGKMEKRIKSQPSGSRAEKVTQKRS
jgi:hypothetical protein